MFTIEGVLDSFKKLVKDELEREERVRALPKRSPSRDGIPGIAFATPDEFTKATIEDLKFFGKSLLGLMDKEIEKIISNVRAEIKKASPEKEQTTSDEESRFDSSDSYDVDPLSGEQTIIE